MKYFAHNLFNSTRIVRLHFNGVGFLVDVVRVKHLKRELRDFFFSKSLKASSFEKGLNVLGKVKNPILKSLELLSFLYEYDVLYFRLGYSHDVKFSIPTSDVKYKILYSGSGNRPKAKPLDFSKLINPFLTLQVSQSACEFNFVMQVKKCCLLSVYTGKGIKFSKEFVFLKKTK